jgi:hypothetical protein
VLSLELGVPLELFYFLSYFSTNYKRREEREKTNKEKKNKLKAHQNSNEDNTFRKISTR